MHWTGSRNKRKISHRAGNESYTTKNLIKARKE